MSFLWVKLSKVSSSFLSGIVLGLPIYITVNDYFFSIARVEGASMQPTLNPPCKKKQSDFVFIDRWHTTPKDIHPGDIVALSSPTNQHVSFIKRVVGVEGDFLTTPRYRHDAVRVPRGHCWVEGDNYRSSLDSNKFGPVSLGLVKGKATHVIWPPRRWSKLEQKIFEGVPTQRRDAKTHDKDKISGFEHRNLNMTIEINDLEVVENSPVKDTEDNINYNISMAVTIIDESEETSCENNFPNKTEEGSCDVEIENE